MRVLVFEVFGKLGHFRRFYTTSSSLTYPFPTPTAIRGLIGAIVGYGKDEYLEKTRGLALTVQILNPISTIVMSANYTNTKKDNKKDPRTQAILHLLKDPKFRIFVLGEGETFEKLKEHLENREFVYTPVLGTSEHLAEIEYLGIFEAKLLENYWGECYTICPVDNFEFDDITSLKIGKELIPYDMENDRSEAKFLEVLYSKEPEKPLRGKFKRVLKIDKELELIIALIPQL